MEPLKIGIKKGEARDTFKAALPEKDHSLLVLRQALEPAKRALALEQKRLEARTTLQAALSPETHDISAAISACEKRGQWVEALRLIQDMGALMILSTLGEREREREGLLP